MNDVLKQQLNELARAFCSMKWHEAEEYRDFSTSDIGVEKLCWNFAVASYSFWNNDNSILEFMRV